MASKKYRFVSPGVQLRELDRSQIPDEPEEIGPVIIGRAQRGPSLQPVKVQSYTEFVQIFGTPQPGGKNGDVWREGNEGLSPQYGAYAAEAWLNNSRPLTFIRLLGRSHADSTTGGEAGWKIGGTPTSNGGGAFGLFLVDSGSSATQNAVTGATGLRLGPNPEENLTLVITDSAGKAVTFVVDYDGSTPTSSTQQRIDLSAVTKATTTATIFKDAVGAAIATASAGGLLQVSATYGPLGTAFVDPMPATDILFHQTLGGNSGNTSFGGTLSGSIYITGSYLTASQGNFGSITTVPAPPFTSANPPAYGPFAGGLGAKIAANVTGTLAAVFYTKANYSMGLSGSTASGSTATVAAQKNVKRLGTTCLLTNDGTSANGGQWTAQLLNTGTPVSDKKFEFNFDSTSDKFIRKVFNTNPTKLNSALYSTTENYFLGETYESVVQSKIASGSAAKSVYGVILGLAGSGFDCDYNVNQLNSNPANSGWVVAQDTGPSGSFDPRNLKKLFKLVALEHGSWANSHIKISIEDIRYSDDPTDRYGSFGVTVRSAKDKDSAPIVLESFSNLNLNPESPNFISNRIGTQYARWSDTDRRWRYYGEYENQSKYIRVIEATGLGDDESLIPFGFQGPIRPFGFQVNSGSLLTRPALPGDHTPSNQNTLAVPLGNSTLDGAYSENISGNPQFVSCMPRGLTSLGFQFPATSLRTSTETGNLSDPTDAYFGVDTNSSNQRFDQSYIDLTRGLPDTVGHGADADVNGPTTSETTNAAEFSYIFTLDNVSRFESLTDATPDEYEAYYVSGSRLNGKSISASGSADPTGYLPASYKATLDAGFNQFTMPMNGGFDGNDITETEAFNNRVMSGKTQLNSYEFNTVKIAIDTCADAENLDMNILSAPGITNTGLTDRVIDVCESRGDALGIIDIQDGYIPPADRSTPGNDYDVANRGNADKAARTFKARQINNSYGAAYYPWTKVRDSESSKVFFSPPSVAAVGTLSYSQAVSEVWFAPAGFNRGGLTAGAAGIPVVGVTEKLSSKQRDNLYENNINPIASFPSEGLVVFGQKTLQSTRSALDRINVRRLLISVKKEISRISNGLLFDPNTQVTWDRFTGQVVPFLESVKARLGLEDFKVVLDNTTTTPDLVDRNIMYAKVFLKPTRAIEFIAVDFVITNTGASFED